MKWFFLVGMMIVMIGCGKDSNLCVEYCQKVEQEVVEKIPNVSPGFCSHSSFSQAQTSEACQKVFIDRFNFAPEGLGNFDCVGYCESIEEELVQKIPNASPGLCSDSRFSEALGCEACQKVLLELYDFAPLKNVCGGTFNCVGYCESIEQELIEKIPNASPGLCSESRFSEALGCDACLKVLYDDWEFVPSIDVCN